MCLVRPHKLERRYKVMSSGHRSYNTSIDVRPELGLSSHKQVKANLTASSLATQSQGGLTKFAPTFNGAATLWLPMRTTIPEAK
mmetsp:Transcript_13605/g.30017  ORF Transcript_13605/g.30017 Transcript_13605/m.30017 type:complete len:84 (+) Transcript_13605:370-621(+)